MGYNVYPLLDILKQPPEYKAYSDQCPPPSPQYLLVSMSDLAQTLPADYHVALPLHALGYGRRAALSNHLPLDSAILPMPSVLTPKFVVVAVATVDHLQAR